MRAFSALLLSLLFAGAAQAARRGAAYLHMGLLADRLQLKHRVERRHFEHADGRHGQEFRDGADGGLADPAVLFLHQP